ncbi:MAG: Stk1 family PASTA domain-containing Ser/Thr kinase [Tissierellia bacterium]|jgi:serine/threonine protein kinase|nr:Stk1 family PASTA domain-containing Ser/Thr kinase [Tissierellia bacterium]
MNHIVLAGRYELLDKIGEGGMAEVYRAVDLVLKRNVAVKLLKQQFVGDQEFITNFGNEAQSAASLNHPNVVNIFDVGKEEIDERTLYYIVMEYIDGRTLKSVIEDEAPMDDERTVRLAAQIAQALKAAHANHIIHRDIKPQNILINEDDEVKVTDFGIAKISTSSTITYTSSILGTVHYISPEQAKGKFIDEKSDLYSLGVVMYELATGNVPFDGENAVAIAISHIQHELIPPKDLNPSLSEGLNHIIVKALEKETATRYQSADEMLRDLREYKTLEIKETEAPADQTTVIPVIKDTPEPDQQDEPQPPSPPRSIYQRTANQPPIAEERPDFFRRVVLPVLLTLFLVGGGFLVIRGILASSENTPATESRSVEIPTLLGKTLPEAQVLAEANGFVIEISEEVYSQEYSEGEILEQSVNPGQSIQRGETVLVKVSLGQELTTVPDLLNLSLADAEARLRTDNLEMGEHRTGYSDTYNEGTVMRQNPEYGERVPVGTAVSVTVSQGRQVEEISMPDLRTNSQLQAIRTLQDLNLRVGQVDSEHSDTYANNTVMRQSVAPGTVVDPQTTIDLVVSLGPAPTEPPATEPPQTEPEQTEPVSDVEYVIPIHPPAQEEGATSYQVHIVRVDGENEEDIRNEPYNYADGTQTIRIMDKPGLSFELYINGNFVRTITH